MSTRKRKASAKDRELATANLIGLTPLQRFIADYYENGEYAHITNAIDAKDVGDGLFSFMVAEAHDAETKGDLANMLGRARDQIEEMMMDIAMQGGNLP